MAFLIPFEATRHQQFYDNIDAKTRRFLNYYAGAKLALEELTRKGVRIDVRVLDTEESPDRSNLLLNDLRDVDVIVGPYDRESLLVAARFAAKHHITVISPWTPSVSIDEESPYFVQMVPGLEAHARAIMEYIGTHFGIPKIYVVSRDDEREAARVQLFSDMYTSAFPGAEPPAALIIRDTLVDLSSMEIETVFAPERPNIFVLPYYSRSDEEFINSVLRKLHADRGENEVYVFGLPQWTSFSGLIADYLEGLNVHVSAANFVDNTQEETQTFNQLFYEHYATIPEPAAMQGYRLTLYLGNALFHYGIRFIDALAAASHQEYFNPQPVFASGAKPEQDNVILYYENKGIEILRYRDQAFHVVE